MKDLSECTDFTNESLEDILEEVKRRYPIGTRYIPAHFGNTGNIHEIENYDGLQHWNKGISLKISHRLSGKVDMLFDSLNKWAKIVTSQKDEYTLAEYKAESNNEYILI